MGNSLWGKEEGACCIENTGFLPLAREDVDRLIRLRVDVGRNGCARMKLPEHGEAAGLLIFVENHQLYAGIRSGLPLRIVCQCDVGEHSLTKLSLGEMQAVLAQNRIEPPANPLQAVPLICSR
jgi:hypothetical protein